MYVRRFDHGYPTPSDGTLAEALPHLRSEDILFTKAAFEPGSRRLAIRTTGRLLTIMVLLPVVYRLSTQLCEGFEESGIVCDAEGENFSLDNCIKRPRDEEDKQCCFSRSVPCPTFQQPLSGITVCILLRAKDGFLG